MLIAVYNLLLNIASKHNPEKLYPLLTDYNRHQKF